MRRSLIVFLSVAFTLSLLPIDFSLPDRSYALSRYPGLTPVRVVAPAIGLNAPVMPVGTTSSGDMDVPDGTTGYVGWYDRGTVPGETGSAVLDAHVFAAFSRLYRLKPGDDIYMDMSDGSVRHFVVMESDTYALQKVPRDMLFARKDAARLNLITCAGSLTKDRSTYDHRLIVYATLSG